MRVFQDRATGITADAAAATYAPHSSTYTNTKVDATTATFSGLIDTASASAADLISGSAALETLHVFNDTPGGKNTLEVKCKPDAINSASLQIEHELTASAQETKLNLRDTSVPNSDSLNSRRR